MSRLTISFVDYNRESSALSLAVAPVTGGNHATWKEDMDSVASIIEDVTLGLVTKRVFTTVTEKTAAPNAAATDENSQRERKWQVSFYDNVNFKSGTMEIPNADLSLLQPNSEYMDISVHPGESLVLALQGFGRSVDGNPITVTSVKHVGRNI